MVAIQKMKGGFKVGTGDIYHNLYSLIKYNPCVIMPASQKCICCCEIDRMMLKKGESARRIECITEHEGFDSVCINVWVLQAAYFSYHYHYGDHEEIFMSKEGSNIPVENLLIQFS